MRSRARAAFPNLCAQSCTRIRSRRKLDCALVTQGWATTSYVRRRTARWRQARHDASQRRWSRVKMKWGIGWKYSRRRTSERANLLYQISTVGASHRCTRSRPRHSSWPTPDDLSVACPVTGTLFRSASPNYAADLLAYHHIWPTEREQSISLSTECCATYRKPFVYSCRWSL